jgi:hypothetical protein
MTALDPVILFFLLGALAGLAKSDLKIPPAVYELLSILLLLTIGLKGGIELSRMELAGLVPQIFVVTSLGVIIPLVLFPLVTRIGRLNRADASSVVAHYGSVSVATFAVGIAFLAEQNVSYDSQLPLFVVLLEVPAIIVGVLLAKKTGQKARWSKVMHEIMFGKSIVLLLGGLSIGWIAGEKGLATFQPLFFDLFKGVLALFLLEMGLIAARQSQAVKDNGLFVIVFGLAAPIPLAMFGIVAGWLIGLNPGGMMMLGVLTGSASYIAAPAAMRIAVPEARPSLPLTASLGVTFPFNIFVGIPIYFAAANALHQMGA